MRLRCYQCHGRFGLTRQYACNHAFCCAKCVTTFYGELAQKIRVLKFLQWLHAA